MPIEIVPVTPPEYAATEDRLRALLATDHDVVVLQGEAVLPLEAAARALARPGARAVNVVTSPYGAVVGGWLRDGGVDVHDVSVPFDRAVAAGAVAGLLETHAPVDVVSLVHAEAASGALNPLAEIAAAARGAGALVVVDAVASFGADAVPLDDVDIVVVSAQKALAGPTGVSAAVVSDRAWSWIDANPAAPRRSILSLLDWRDRWLRDGRQTLPVIPHHVELRLFDEALAEAIAAGGLDAVVARHRVAAEVARQGLAELELAPWIAEPEQRSNVTTTFRPPGGVSVPELLDAVGPGTILGAAPAAPEHALRLVHAGVRATPGDVTDALEALRRALSPRR